MIDIREQIKGAKVFAALSMAKPTHHLCGIKVELLVDTIEKMLAVYEAAERLSARITIEGFEPSVVPFYIALVDAIDEVEAPT